ncbi:MAG: Holliday junction branch migration protein RuvA [Oscillospiraceae bacterium]|nr:Holliday junction branch migration protein RuvA [Oscillospiraceae bacterium]
MIYSVRGKLAAMEPGLAVVECAGVGYACRTSSNTLSQIRDKGEVFLYTYLHITENAVDLFGFADSSELSCFKQLISVSGVGPKAALSILSDITPSKLALCIATGDSKTLTRSPGIGNKIAQKIVFELKDKIAKEQRFSSAELQNVPQLGGNNASEAMEALAVLGFAPAQINSALMGADPNASVEELIKFGLKNLASG